MRRFPNKLVLVTRLERQVLGELWQSFGVAVGALTLLMVVAASYEAVSEGLPVPSLVRYVPLVIPYTLPWTIPTAFTTACIMVYSRMAGDNELTAVRASGIHLWRVLTPAAAAAVLLSALCGVLNHDWVPRTRFLRFGIRRGVSASEQLATLRAVTDPVLRVGQYKMYVGDVDEEGGFRDIVIVVPEKILGGGKSRQKQITYIRAPRARYEYSDERSQIVIHIERDPPPPGSNDPDAGKGTMYKVIHGTTPLDFERAAFGSATITIQLRSMADLRFVPHDGKHMTTAELMLKVRARLRSLRTGERKPPDTSRMTGDRKKYAEKKWRQWLRETWLWRTEVHKRSAFSLAPLLLGAIAVPLGVMTGRGRKLAAFGLGVLVVLGGYYPLMAFATKLGRAGVVPSAVAVWGMTAAVACVAGCLFRKMLKR